MSKITTNNYVNAFNQAQAYEKLHGVKSGAVTERIPKEINKVDGINHYHVLMVNKRHDAVNERYIVTGNVQTFGKGKPFEKISKNFKNLGFSSLIVIHDPTNNPVENTASVGLKQHEKSVIARRIEKEEEEEKNARVKRRLEDAEAKAKAEEEARAKELAEKAKAEEEARAKSGKAPKNK